MPIKVREGGEWVQVSDGAGGSEGFVTGMIMMFSGTTAPTGWVLCDNSTEAQAANAPDLRDRFVVGAGSNYAVGNTGGSADSTLVSHSHTVTGSTNQRGGIARWEPSSPSPNVTSGGGDQILFDEGNVGDGEETDFNGGHRLRLDTRHTHTVSGTAGSQGSSATNANLPPYYALSYIMKI